MDEVTYFLILCLVTFITGIAFTIIVHESGHLVFGLLSGYRFLLFRIWKFAVVRAGSRYRFFIVSKPDSLGQCIMYPGVKSRNPKIMIWGGIISNLSHGILLISTGLFLRDHIFACMLELLGWLNVLCAFINYFSRYITDDGQSIRDMKKPTDIECYNCQLMIARNLVNGYSYKDMDTSIFIIGSLSPDSSSYEKEMYFYEYYRLLELGSFTQAEERLNMLVTSDIDGWLAKEVCRERKFFLNLRVTDRGALRNELVAPSDIRINHLDAALLKKFNRYIYPGEVKSTKIVLEEIKKKYLGGGYKN